MRAWPYLHTLQKSFCKQEGCLSVWSAVTEVHSLGSLQITARCFLPNLGNWCPGSGRFSVWVRDLVSYPFAVFSYGSGREGKFSAFAYLFLLGVWSHSWRLCSHRLITSGRPHYRNADTLEIRTWMFVFWQDHEHLYCGAVYYYYYLKVREREFFCVFTAGAQSSQEWAEPKPGSAATWSAHQQEGRSEAQYLELNQALGCCLWPPQAMTLLL